MTMYEFLDKVCERVKYKSIHNAIRQEISNHVEETALGYEKMGDEKDAAVDKAIEQLGDAAVIGTMFNEQYRLPFNFQFGLAVWAALVTIVIYVVYPILYIFWKNRILPHPYRDFVVIGIILVFMFLNVLYLRRGRKIVSLRDLLNITVGFLVGYAISCVILVTASELTKSVEYPYLHYAYIPSVKLLITPPFIPFLPINSTNNIFAMQVFCWWLCIIVYVISVKSKKELKPSFILNCFEFYNIRDGKWVGNFEEFNKGKTADGRVITHVVSAFMGFRTDKYGEKITDMRENNDELI